jgi:SAM-dependent methyltransferase
VIPIPPDDAWAPHVERFVDVRYSTLGGRVRTHVIDAHLRQHLPAPPAPVLDVGGGAGNQSIPLARRGHPVTILDSSPAMLSRARERLAGEPAETAARVRLIEATAEDARRAVGDERFASVLCHEVIMYFEDPRPLVAALAELVRPGGIVSVLAKNARALAVRPALEGRWADALAAFDRDREVNSLGLDTRGDTVDGLAALMVEHGLKPIAWYGVRLFTDHASPPAPEDSALTAQALAVELKASRRDPYRQLSRLFHMIARAR